MNKTYTLIIAVLLLVTAGRAQQVLDEYLTTAAENNPGLRAQFNQYMAALEKAPQAGSLPDPTVAFGWFVQPVETRVGPQQSMVSASQMFPWFGTLAATETAAVRNAKAAYEAFLQTKSRLFHEVRSVYYDLYFNRRSVALTRENLMLLDSFQKLARVKIKAGTASALDEYRIEMEIGDLNNQLARLRDKQLELQVTFNNLLNNDHVGPVHTPDSLWNRDLPFSKAQIADSVRANNHLLQKLAHEQEALTARKTAARKAGAPAFTLGMDYRFIGKGEDNRAGTDAFVFPKLGIKLPLYRKKYKAMVDEVRYQQTAKSNEQKAAENNLENLLQRGWNDYQDADRRIELYRSQIELAERSLRLLETEYSTGGRSFEEVLRMERKALKYGIEYERARADKQAAISFITFLMGQS